MAVKNVTIKQGQTLFDLALQLYGNVESVFTILADNTNILNLHHSPLARVEIQYTEQNNDVVNYFKTNNKTIATGYNTESGNVSANTLLNDDGIALANDDGVILEID